MDDLPAPVPEELNEREEEFARLYVYGSDDADRPLAGNASRCYFRVYDCKLSTARSAAFRLLKRERVRARIAQLRQEARTVLEEVMPDWEDEVRDALRTLRWARTGRWPDRFAGDDQMKRSAVEAAEHTLDRALGSVKQMHELDVTQRQLVVQVAGEAHAPQVEEEPDGRELDSGHAGGLEEGDEEEDSPYASLLDDVEVG